MQNSTDIAEPEAKPRKCIDCTYFNEVVYRCGLKDLAQIKVRNAVTCLVYQERKKDA